MDIQSRFQSWALEFSGCDGGDIGTNEKPSIWVCGIEWGGGHTPSELLCHMAEDEREPPVGYEDWRHNLAYIFNWQAVKLLNVIAGGKASEYRKFAESVQPFTQGSAGFFKMNLFPIAFKNTSEKKWKEEFSQITGFENKRAYIDWCKEKRFPVIQKWTQNYTPELIICLGKTYIQDFARAFACEVDGFDHKMIDDRDLYWQKNMFGSLVVVLPFMVNRYGLVKNTSIQKFGEEIKSLPTIAYSGPRAKGARVRCRLGVMLQNYNPELTEKVS